MKKRCLRGLLKAQMRVGAILREERGETNIIAIILLIIVVIAVVAIFKDRLTQIVNSLFDKIQEQVDTI